MTVLSTVLAAVPLVVSTGACAESRFSIGIVIIGGFLGASVPTLFLTPVLYDLTQRPRSAGHAERRPGAVEGAAPLGP
ncbi:AcrB/AcrD/AcrF family protein [Rhodovulum sp. ES.010]|uniref:efflux RND transporter permease subunit n=1 Tax=Rhodovulum sp. ES.010 TaxID=1882821 RepID=UPI000925A344|nr:efflux RND transporter permease subunit [Rhodovulum sp. ES.010]SIO32215.1 AcrB/AcrD/AcrF family protein [Rhodovulum sp. ES.010]